MVIMGVGEFYRILSRVVEAVNMWCMDISGASLLRSLNFLDLPRLTKSLQVDPNHC